MSFLAFERARSLAHALAVLRGDATSASQRTEMSGAAPSIVTDADVRLLAGGQTLIPALRLGFDAPSLLLDLQQLPELRGLRVEDEHLWIGAMSTHAQVAGSPLVQRHLPGLAWLARGIADAQVRNRGTLGGSIANADPAACWPAGLLALAAEVVTDRRVIVADDFFVGLFETALKADEIICGVRFPVAARLSYLKYEQPASRFALTGVAVARWPQAAGGAVRIAVTGLGNGVCRWHEAEAQLGREFAAHVLDGLHWPAAKARSDIHASAEYRAHLVQVLAQRAIEGESVARGPRGPQS